MKWPYQDSPLAEMTQECKTRGQLAKRRDRFFMLNHLIRCIYNYFTTQFLRSSNIAKLTWST